MVFSFFKKQPEKVIARPAAVPRQTGARENAPSSGNSSQAAPQEQTTTNTDAAKAATVAETPLSDFSDFKFSQSSLDFQIEAEVDPHLALPVREIS